MLLLPLGNRCLLSLLVKRCIVFETMGCVVCACDFGGSMGVSVFVNECNWQ